MGSSSSVVRNAAATKSGPIFSIGCCVKKGGTPASAGVHNHVEERRPEPHRLPHCACGKPCKSFDASTLRGQPDPYGVKAECWDTAQEIQGQQATICQCERCKQEVQNCFTCSDPNCDHTAGNMALCSICAHNNEHFMWFYHAIKKGFEKAYPFEEESPEKTALAEWFQRLEKDDKQNLFARNFRGFNLNEKVLRPLQDSFRFWLANEIDGLKHEDYLRQYLESDFSEASGALTQDAFEDYKQKLKEDTKLLHDFDLQYSLEFLKALLEELNKDFDATVKNPKLLGNIVLKHSIGFIYEGLALKKPVMWTNSEGCLVPHGLDQADAVYGEGGDSAPAAAGAGGIAFYVERTHPDNLGR